MKASIVIGLSTVILMSMSQFTMAGNTPEKRVCTDRISTSQAVKVEAAKTKRVQRNDRVVFHKAVLDQPSLQPKRIARTDRIVLNQP